MHDAKVTPQTVTGKIDVDGNSVRVSVKPGAIGKTPLIIFNGIGASLELLSPLVADLHAANPGMAVITLDCPGAGQSSTPLMPYRFSCLATMVAKILDMLGIDRINVLGLSWGGFLAQQFAHDYPDKCARLILAATCAGVDAVSPSPEVLSIMSSPRRYTDPEYAASVAPEIYGGQFRTDPVLAAQHAYKVARYASTSVTGYAYQAMAVYWWSSMRWLHKIQQPTLVLAGNDDPIIPLINMEEIARLIPDADLHVFDDGHLFLLTEPAAITVIDAFLNN